VFNEVEQDLLKWQPKGNEFVPVWKLLPTNYMVDAKGLAIMSAGLADAYSKENELARYTLGVQIQCNPAIPRVLPLGYYHGAFWWATPTKRSPFDAKSDVDMIRNSLWEMKLYHNRQIVKPIIILPRLGCGGSKLRWGVVKNIIHAELKDIEEVYICHLVSWYQNL